MGIIQRLIQSKIKRTLDQGKSILLLGPRQTGKTTLLTHQVQADFNYSFIQADIRRHFEANPESIIGEIEAAIKLREISKNPVIFIDEVQKVPAIMDPVQEAIDKHLARFILTGSSARKLVRNRKGEDINLLPGRVIKYYMDALCLLEFPEELPDINELILHGCLPEVVQLHSSEEKDLLLTSYVSIYLEEEIRAEAIVRNLSSFSRFLTYAAVEAGSEVNINNLSQEVGVSRYTIGEYYQILLDCLIANRVEPITNSITRRRLTKSPKYLFFDMGVRRVAAGEGVRLPLKYYGQLFEQFIGIELLKLIHLYAPQAKLRYWHDHAGAEVDYVIEYNRQYIPIEVKWTTKPSRNDARHLVKFLKEYECIKPAYVVCQTPRSIELSHDVFAISWKKMSAIIRDILIEN